jgi:hypothetical protein
MRQRKEDFLLRLISSVQTKSGWGTGEIKVWVSGNSASISKIVKSDLEPLADAVRQGIADQHAAPPTAPSAAPADDPYEALRKLASASIGYGPDGKRVRNVVSGKTKQEVKDKLKASMTILHALFALPAATP